MAMCFPSMAPKKLWKFHNEEKKSAICSHSASVVGAAITSLAYSSMMAWQTSLTIEEMVS